MERLIKLLHEIDFEKVEEMLQQYKDPATFAKDYEVHETSGFVKDFIDQKIAENAKSRNEEMKMRDILEDNILEEVTLTYLGEAKNYPTGDDEALCEDAAWDYFLNRYREIQFEESHSYSSAAYHDYGPCNPWDAPGMSVSDFI